MNAHSMKSALANIGEMELSAAATALEQAGRASDAMKVLEELPSFLNGLCALINRLKPSEDEQTDSDNNLDSLYLREKMLVIQKSCAEYDKKTAKSALAELKQKAWPRSINEKFSDIAEHLLHSEFEEASAVVMDFMENNQGCGD
jgi:hypothetical protein